MLQLFNVHERDKLYSRQREIALIKLLSDCIYIYMHGKTNKIHQVCFLAHVLITEIDARTRCGAAMLKESEHSRSGSELVEERRERRIK